MRTSASSSSKTALIAVCNVGDPATTVLVLKAKLAVAHERQISDQTELQRLQAMLASTQDNANLADSCLMKKLHASQHAADSAQEALAVAQQQCTSGLLAAQRQFHIQHAATKQQLVASTAQTEILQEQLYAKGEQFSMVPEMTTTQEHVARDAQRKSAVKGYEASLQGNLSIVASQGCMDQQLIALQQQNEQHLGQMHQQYRLQHAEQVAQQQQAHADQLAAFEIPQSQEGTHRPGFFQLLLGKLTQFNAESVLKLTKPYQHQIAVLQQHHEAALGAGHAQQLKYAQQVREVIARKSDCVAQH